MSTPAKLRIVLGADNCVKLTLPCGIPDSVDILKFEIQKQCGIEGVFRLPCMDNDFDQFMNLTSLSEQSTQPPIEYSISTFSGDG